MSSTSDPAQPTRLSPVPARAASQPNRDAADLWRLPDWDSDHPHLVAMRRAALELDWSRPLAALDVDGVLAPFSDDASDAWSDWSVHSVNGFTMAFSPSMMSRLAALDASRVWLTTWEEDANRDLVPLLGWRPLPVLLSDWRTRHFPSHPSLPSPVAGPGFRWWKLSVLARLLRFVADDPYEDGLSLPPALVWVDDELEDAPSARRWAEALPFPALVVSPSPNRGLSPRQVDRIEAFVASHTGVV